MVQLTGIEWRQIVIELSKTLRTLQEYLPNPRHREFHRIFVTAKPADAWKTARHFDAAQIPWVKLLFAIRTLPNRVNGQKDTAEDIRPGVDLITDSSTGVVLLREIPEQIVVVGSVGKFWHLQIPFADVTPDHFCSFDTPGWGKLAWAISVDPFGEGSTISVELRMTATDDASWKKFIH